MTRSLVVSQRLLRHHPWSAVCCVCWRCRCAASSTLGGQRRQSGQRRTEPCVALSFSELASRSWSKSSSASWSCRHGTRRVCRGTQETGWRTGDEWRYGTLRPQPECRNGGCPPRLRDMGVRAARLTRRTYIQAYGQMHTCIYMYMCVCMHVWEGCMTNEGGSERTRLEERAREREGGRG